MAKLPAINKDHEVPSAYWKVIALVEGSTTKVSAFYFYQDTPKRADYCDHAKAVAFIERKSGLDFFSAMPDAAEDTLESSNPMLVAELGC
jgi:endonuclease G